MFDVCVNATNLSTYVIDAGNEIVWAATPLFCNLHHGRIRRYFDGVVDYNHGLHNMAEVITTLGDSGFIVISDWSTSRVASNVLCAVAATVSD